ncbi:MAG: cysteine-rich CWC family protein [Cytophagales bacterium]|nr:cysteine-rich CWC family protein [Cytophagales bacterium]
MKTETKICPKCGDTFECNNYNIFKCACINVPLDASARQLIAETYDDCLCISCLREYAAKCIAESDIKD